MSALCASAALAAVECAARQPAALAAAWRQAAGAAAAAGASLSEGLWLGRGDRKTRRGKIAVGTSGLARPSLRNARRERERRLLGPFQSPRAWSNFDPDAQQETRAMRRLRENGGLEKDDLLI